MKYILSKLLKNLLRPDKILIKIFNNLNYYYNYRKYNQDFFEKEQNDLFKYFGLNREQGIKNLHIHKKKLNLNFEKTGMSSEHEVFFSSLSIDNNKSISDILEIGTFDGYNALLFSKLFEQSNIDTIDLLETDDDFKNFYNRSSKISEFIKKRNFILSKNENINFFSQNSLNLLNYKKKYDLIWIDGAHGYPVACIDIINSLHILRENGLIVCDDVRLQLNPKNSDKMYNSLATYETLKELKQENLISFKLIYKRLHAKNNCIKKDRKFLAIVTKV